MQDKPKYQIAIAAALRYELNPLKKMVIPNVGFLCTGMGSRNTGISLTRFLMTNEVKNLLFVGMAGSLCPQLQFGDVVVITNIAGHKNLVSSRELLSCAKRMSNSNSLRIKFGSVYTANKVICTANEKKKLAEKLGIEPNGVVDMESSTVAETCKTHRIPFLIIRTVSDLYEEDLPLDFNKCVTDRGDLSLPRVLVHLLANPKAVPGMIELKKRNSSCSKNLKNFLEPFLKNFSDTKEL